MFDLGGVVFRWQPLVLLQELLPTRAPNETEASKWASAILQILHPEGYWALFDLRLTEPDPLAQRTSLAESDLRYLIANIPAHLWPIPGTAGGLPWCSSPMSCPVLSSSAWFVSQLSAASQAG